MRALTVALALATAILPRTADAFCGFYVAGSGEKLVNDATQVVLMRKGTRTVLAMQNDYKGPPQDFAMVVPVPVVLRESDVKTLPKDVFAHVEQMGAPRLVEYWEQDPCALEPSYNEIPKTPMATNGPAGADAQVADLGVKVEARFAVGEYQIVILSAKDSTGLETWLRAEHYQIPDGAEPLLRPYVESGMKFFVAKIDPQKLKFDNGRAALSPLRFFYDSDEFALPIRLGTANSSGKQDLIVNILAPNQRYAVANYPNVTIPTNLDLTPGTTDKFAAFYAALYDRTVEKHPGAVVTEYAWQATTCDPCPGPALDGSDFLTLGADVLAGTRDKPEAYPNADFVLTRLHARYGRELPNDLTFATAPPIAGGREHLVSNGRLEEGAQPDQINNFQARYAIRHAWTGPIACEAPRRGRWGGPPADGKLHEGYVPARPALGIAFAPRDTITLATAVMRDVPELDLHAGAPDPIVPVARGSAAPTLPAIGDKPAKKSGCGCQTTSSGDFLVGVALIGGTCLVRRRRRNQRVKENQ